MLVFWKARLVLLAVPKTGTTALEAALLPHADTAILNPPQHKHCTLRRYRTQLQRFFEPAGHTPFETAAIIREPLDWLASWYRYRARPQIAGTDRSTAGVSFDDFAASWLRDTPPEFAKVGRQSRFVAAPGGAVGVDHLFRHDQPDVTTRFLADRLGVALSVGRANVSARVDTTLSGPMRARLHDEAPEEFALWDRLVADHPDERP